MIFIFDLQGASYFIRGLCGIRSGACRSERWRNCKLCLRFYCFCGKNVNFVARKILLVMESKLTLYNTLDRRKGNLRADQSPHVGMYVCGPTVYGDPHLGHARPAVTFDLLFRYLRSLGYKVRYVRNVTDVGHLEHDADDGEDKISKKARLEQLEPMEVAHYYTERYHRAMDEPERAVPLDRTLRQRPYHRADRHGEGDSRQRFRLRIERVGLFRCGEIQPEIQLRPSFGPQPRRYSDEHARAWTGRATSAIRAISPSGRRLRRSISCAGLRPGATASPAGTWSVRP